MFKEFSQVEIIGSIIFLYPVFKNLKNKKIMTKQQVIDLMKSSKSVSEWNGNCDKVKAAFDGGYPEFWYATIIMSGIIQETCKNFTNKKTA